MTIILPQNLATIALAVTNDNFNGLSSNKFATWGGSGNTQRYPTLTNKNYGGPADNWGLDWSGNSALSNGQFHVLATLSALQNVAVLAAIDYVEPKIYYTVPDIIKGNGGNVIRNRLIVGG